MVSPAGFTETDTVPGVDPDARTITVTLPARRNRKRRSVVLPASYTARNLDLFVRLLEPVMLLVMASVTLLIVLGLLMPVFKMGQTLK